MMLMLRHVGLWAISSLFCFNLFTSISNSQTTNVQISPTKTEVSANPGDKKQFNITLKNIGTQNQTFNIIFNDFTNSEDESGSPKILETGSIYGAASWLSTANPVTIDSNQIKNLAITISVPKDAKSGTYYGIVRTSTDNDVASVASLVFVDVANPKREIGVEEFNKSGSQLVARVRNTGPGFVKPDLKIEIYEDEKIVKTIDANPGQNGVITNTVRKYAVDVPDNLDPNKNQSAKLIARSENTQQITKELTLNNSNKNTETQASDKQKKQARILLITGGIISLIVIVGIFALFLLKKRKNKLRSQQSSPVPNTPPEISSNPSSIDQPQLQNQDSPDDPELKQ